MSDHARLSPSSSHRWINCPGSILLSEKVGSTDSGSSVYATEGTKAHELGEMKAGRAFGLITEAEYREHWARWRDSVDESWVKDMEHHTDGYVELLKEYASRDKDSTVLLEQRVHTDITGCWGTADALIIADGVLTVVDLKYGMGVPVDAKENTQLMLYAVGAVGEYGLIHEFDMVTMVIFQPRLGGTSHFSMMVSELLEWQDTIKPIAESALEEGAEIVPSEESCRYCPAAGICKVRKNHMLAQDFGDPNLMDPEDLADALGKVKMIKRWCEDIEKQALQEAYTNGVELPGWKVVWSGGRRTIKDVERAIQRFVDEGFTPEDVADYKMKTLSELKGLVGGDEELQEVLGNLLVKGDGRPSIVAEDDKRPAIDPVAEAQSELSE